MATGIPKSYTRSTLQKMQESRAKLKLQQGLLSDDNPDELPNFEVWKYSSSERLDKAYGNHPRYLSGTAQLVAVQASAIKALHDELSLRLGYATTFEEWFEDWQKGYPSLINRKGTNSKLKTNYPIASTQDSKGWREDLKSRPEYNEWRNPKQNRKSRIIEYYPEGLASPEKSMVFSGSDSQLIQSIQLYTWIIASIPAASNEVFEGGWHGGRKGQPEILFIFWEDKKDVAETYDQVKAKVRIRIMDKTDDPDSSMEKLTWNDIRQLQQKIYEIFVTPNNGNGFIWKKGKELVNYTDRNAGYQNNIVCRDEEEGKRVVEALLAIQGKTLDETKLRPGKPYNPALTYPTIPPTKIVLGKSKRMPRLRPIADVRFCHATLFLQYYGSPIPLISHRQLMALPGG